MGRTKARKSIVRLDGKLLKERNEWLKGEVAKLRLAFEKDLIFQIEQAKKQLPPNLLQLKLKDFLLLTDLIHLQTFQQKRRRRTSIASLLESTKVVDDSGRRMTRSRTSMAPQAQVMAQPAVPATPKFHPALPETPAAYRRMAAPAVPTFAPAAAPLRITRSTIKVDPFDGSKPKGKKEPVVGVVSLELGNGETFDVDLTRSPRTLLSTLGSDALREVKQKMQTYASQLRSFFGKLQV